MWKAMDATTTVATAFNRRAMDATDGVRGAIAGYACTQVASKRGTAAVRQQRSQRVPAACLLACLPHATTAMAVEFHVLNEFRLSCMAGISEIAE